MQQAIIPAFDVLRRLQGTVPLEALAVLLGAIAIAAILKALSLRRKRGAGYSLADLRQKPILTPNEQEFFGRLRRALPDYLIFPQVSLDALLSVSPNCSRAAKVALRNTYSQKHPDFVVCKPETLEVVAIVELDDRTHKIENDRKRDAMLQAAGYRVERFQSKAKPSEAQITALLATLSMHEI